MTAVVQQDVNLEKGELRLKITRTWIDPDNLFIMAFDAILRDTIRQIVNRAGIDYAALGIMNGYC